MTDPDRLPIEDHLDAVVARWREGHVVLVAEPGAGKTTMVPPALLAAMEADAGDAADTDEIVVLAPRRMAARLAARRVAALLGEPVGQRCGYEVRFDHKVSSRTKIRFMTEGLFTRRLRSDPTLAKVGTVIFDELHERHLDADLGLALTRALTRPRPLRIVAMSATIDAAPVARFLDAPVIEVPGRTFPVEIEHLGDDGRPLERRVLRALTDEVDRGLDGHVLVFLPGAAEIRRTAEACEGYARAHGFALHTLHGELAPEKQDQAIAPPADRKTRKLILSTNVAETSVTIDGIALVIDSGLARIASHDPWTGIARLDLGPISRASATQRAGRAGRTRAGRCVRLYGRGDFERRRAFDRPEIATSDLSALALDVAAAGHRLDGLAWLEPPPPVAAAAATELLELLGAIERDAGDRTELTEVGRALLDFPLPPRLARLVVAGEALGIARLAADVAAVLAERPLPRDHRRRADADAAADPLVDLAVLDGHRRTRRDEAPPRALMSRIGRARKQLADILRARPRPARDTPRPRDDTPRPRDDEARDAALCRALLAAFPDRVAQVQPDSGPTDGRRRLALAGGGSAILSPASHVRSADWVVALDVDTRAGTGGGDKTLVRAAAAIDPDWLIEDHAEHIDERDALDFDERRGRVIHHAELRYRGLLLERDTRPARPGEAATAVLRRAAASRPFAAFLPKSEAETFEQLRLRAAFLARHRPDSFAPLDDARLEALRDEACEGLTSFEELRNAGLGYLARNLVGDDVGKLDTLAPHHVQLAGGRRLPVHYEPNRDPWVASRLQDFFGSVHGPAVLDGAVPLVLHLRAPNNRDVQVTTDLDGFWSRHYPDLRKALMRRYPKHAWPEDPRTASPPAPRQRRRR